MEKFNPENGTIFQATHQGDILTIIFRNNMRKYEYQPVTKENFDALKAAESPGSYLRKEIIADTEISCTEV